MLALDFSGAYPGRVYAAEDQARAIARNGPSGAAWRSAAQQTPGEQVPGAHAFSQQRKVDAMSKTATFVRDLTGFTGAAKLYKLDPAFEERDWRTDEVEATHEHVIVSATIVPWGGGPETYIFPATADGEIADWGELSGSYKGGLDHATALENAGYAVALRGPVLHYSDEPALTHTEERPKMTCQECGCRLSWGEMLIPVFRVNREGDVETSGYAHKWHFSNPDED